MDDAPDAEPRRSLLASAFSGEDFTDDGFAATRQELLERETALGRAGVDFVRDIFAFGVVSPAGDAAVLDRDDEVGMR